MKKLYKSNQNKQIDGVCSGIAEYLSIDPTVIRVIFAIAACIGGIGILAYLLCALIIPQKPSGYIDV